MPIEYMRPEHRGDINCCRCCSVTQSCLILCNCIDWNIQVCLFFTMSWSLLKFMSTESVMPFTHLVLCCPHLLLTSVFPSIRIFSTELAFCIRWPKYWSFSFSIIPSSEYSGLISFRIQGFDLHAVQGTLRSLIQHHYSKASILWCSAFFMVQLSHLYMTTGKNHSFDHTDLGWQRHFNMLPRFFIAFLPWSKYLLISWLQSSSLVILEPKKIRLYFLLWSYSATYYLDN